jgi:hypothetical protein
MTIGRLTIFKKSIIGEGTPLLIRYVLFRLPAFGVYLHKLCRSDYDRALHDHPWPFVSIVLRRGYTEVHDQTVDGTKVHVFHKPGSVLLRPAEWRHRVIVGARPAWTLVLVGRRQRRWGFWLPDGWCWWRRHNSFSGTCEDGIVHRSGED